MFLSNVNMEKYNKDVKGGAYLIWIYFHRVIVSALWEIN